MRSISLWRLLPALVLPPLLVGAGEGEVDLLPDLVVDPSALLETRIDQTTLPGHRLLRLSTSTPNIGAGPLEVRGSTIVAPDAQQVLQRIFRADGSYWDRLAGTFAYHPTHGHTHFDGWAVYRLRARSADGAVGAILAQGDKTSFCLLDVVAYAEDGSTLGSTPPHYTTCGQMVQGISPGWSDVYDLELDDQWIDISDLPDGSYWLEAEVDPGQQVLEEPDGETNNIARVALDLTGDAVAFPETVPVPPPDLPGPGRGGGCPRQSGTSARSAATECARDVGGAGVRGAARAVVGERCRCRSGRHLAAGGSRQDDGRRHATAGRLPEPAQRRGPRGHQHRRARRRDLVYLLLQASDGGATTSRWAYGAIVVYHKGDLDGDGHVDRADWVLLVQRRRAQHEQPLSAAVAGWEALLDFDRDADVDEHDLELFRSVALATSTHHD